MNSSCSPVAREGKLLHADDSYPLTWVQRQHSASVIVIAVQNDAAARIGIPLIVARSDPQRYVQLGIG
jgi:hypothetical protein